MRPQEQFLNFVQDDLVPRLRGAEKIRRSALRYKRMSGLFVLLFVISIPLIVLSLPSFYYSEWLSSIRTGLIQLGIPDQEGTTQVFAILMGGSLLLMIGIGILGKIKRLRFEKALEDEGVTLKIVDFLNPGVTFEKEGFISKETARESQLFPEHWNMDFLRIYKGDDYFSGKVGSVTYELSEIEIHSARRISKTGHTRGSGRGQDERIIIRHNNGLFMVADFLSPSGARTFILPTVLEQHLGALGRIFQAKSRTLFGENYRLVQMDDEPFEKKFRVYSANEEEARSLVTEKFRMHLLAILGRAIALKGQYKRIINGKTVYSYHITSFPGDMRICLTGKKLYLYIETGPLFLPNIKNSVLQPETFQVFYDDLSLALYLIEELDRHVRFAG